MTASLGVGRLAVAFGLGLAVAACETSEPMQMDADFCGAVGGYVSPCDEPTDCEKAIVRDCDSLQQALAPGYAAAVQDCMLGLGDPMGCLADSVEQTPSSSDLADFATTLCLECGDGAGEDCENMVKAGQESNDLARAGRLARTLSVAVLDDVTAECATGEGCANTFLECAIDIVSRSIPDETAYCLGDAAVNGAPDEVDCSAQPSDDGVADGGTGGDDGGDGGGTGNSDTGGADDGSADDGMADGGTGECTAEGCPCMFTEDCDAGLTCNGTMCTVPTECDDDPNEPNDDESTATYLPPIGDNDGRAAQVTGLLDHPSDVDWFRYDGSDNWNGLVNPYAQVNVFALEVCLYAECLNGLENTDVTCPDGTTQSPSPGGRPGCCAANTMGFELNMSCGSNPFGSESSTVYMSVTGSESGVCQEFTLGYHF